MTIKSSLRFTYKGISSEDFGLIIAKFSDGLYEESLLAGREVKYVNVNHSKKFKFQRIDYKPITISIQVAFEDEFDRDKLRTVARWLTSDDLEELTFDGCPERIFYAIVHEETKLNHTGSYGYFDLNFWTPSPFSYSSIYTTPEYDFSDNATFTNISIQNLGDESMFPEVTIVKVGTGDISIINTTNGNEETKFVGLTDGEQIYLNSDPENREITSSLEPVTYGWDRFNNNFIEIVYGVNNLKITGTCKITFRYQYTYYQ